ncbi:Bug family tripartite tricarboxylate transporter substrate binding protein [Cupriavidus basilensis]|uniref:Tripartite tricarboxylate transporter substrate binding protein n=1 Tax=Cupriavidus basilensis TaxID=68895 RepID=A0A7M2HC27_9BURK|nr:tripartite tricarboxylate transporter substrate binding protein [Cupriavidus basilensis]QOT82137.1 tripartite tricarboxylate transporter substrate binding protein [Cupriavidus basilensis]
MKHLPFRLRLVALGLSAVAALGAPASSQAEPPWPARPIAVIVPFPPGPVDVNVRILTTKVSAILGQPLVLENRPGAGQRIGGAALTRAPRDGYTIGVVTQAGLVVALVLDATTQYDVHKDFTYLTMGYESPFVITAPASSGIRTLGQLVDQAKAKPGIVKFGSTGAGTAFHIWTEAFNGAAGIQLLHVPYKGESPLLQDLAGGQVDMAFSSPTMRNLVDAGKLVALATTGERRASLFPGVPTVREQGIPYTAVSWLGFGAPAGIPDAVRDRLVTAFHQAMRDPQVQATFKANGLQLLPTSPEAFRKQVASEISRMKELVAAQGIRLD